MLVWWRWWHWRRYWTEEQVHPLFDTSDDIKLPWHPTIRPHCSSGTVVQHAKNVNQLIRKVVAPLQNQPEGVSVDRIVCLLKVYKGQMSEVLNSLAFSARTCREKIWSMYPHPLQKPRWPSFSRCWAFSVNFTYRTQARTQLRDWGGSSAHEVELFIWIFIYYSY